MTACHLCGTDLAGHTPFDGPHRPAASLIIETGRYGEGCRSVCCAVCGLVQQDPMPTAEQLDAYYRTEYRRVHRPLAMDIGGVNIPPPQDYDDAPPDERERGVQAYWNAHDMRAQQKVSEHEETRPAIIQSLGVRSGHRVLEIGCGDGRIAAALIEAGIDVVAIEPDDACRNEAIDRGVECYPNLAASVSDDGPFDGALLVHSLEHMLEPVATLRAVRAMLKPRRRVYVEVPNLAHPYGALSWFFQRPHLYNFAPPTLSDTARCAGFAPVGRLVSGFALWAVGENAGGECEWSDLPVRPNRPADLGAWWSGWLMAYEHFVGKRGE